MLQEKSTFIRLLKRDCPLLLDGGLATQLEAQGCDISNALWSASMLEADPDSIVQAHLAYLAAGAECVATASYQASRKGFQKQGFGEQEADELMLLSVALAKRARDEAGADAAIAASLGPYGAMLHDGSEYSGNYGVSSQTLREFHEPRIALFDAAGVDVLALETIPSLQEAEVLVELLAHCETPSWISFSCRDELHSSDGRPLSEIAALFRDHKSVCAIGVNCTSPAYVVNLIGEIRRAAPDKFALAYPNSGEAYDANDKSWHGTVTPGDCASAARRWLDAGATIIGGCCRMGPRHIRAMAMMIRESQSLAG